MNNQVMEDHKKTKRFSFKLYFGETELMSCLLSYHKKETATPEHVINEEVLFCEKSSLVNNLTKLWKTTPSKR